MRHRQFCCYSFFLVFAAVMLVNLYFFKTTILTSNRKVQEHLTRIWFAEQASDASFLYKIWPIFMTSKDMENSVDLTIVTQTSVNNLPSLQQLVLTWDGPVSVSVFAPGKDISIAVEAIFTLRQCNNVIRENVMFSLVLALSHPPMHKDLSFYMRKAAGHPRVCPLSLSESPGRRRKNYADKNVQYPVNLLRNVAVASSRTSHILMIDIDMSPSPSLRKNFQISYPLIRRQNAVYVIPTFELKKGIKYPMKKETLIKLWNSRKARPFYKHVCWKCQKYTDYDKWKRSSSAGLSIGYKVEWQDPWEPFFIAEKNAVWYDERFKQYGFNRISQVCETHVSGHDFYVLDNAFLIHDGFKEAETFHQSKNEENAMNRDLFRIFKQELKKKYPASQRKC